MSESDKNVWRPLVDPRSKKVYYVNVLTRQTTWTNPHAPQTEEWVQYTDAKGRHYYMNKISRKSTWTKPDDFDEDALDYATHKKRKEKSNEKTWTKHIDPSTRQPYWIDQHGSISTTNPTGETESNASSSAYGGDDVDDGVTGDADEEVWTVPLTVKHADTATQKEKVAALMDKVEGGVVKDISEIKDFSTKKLNEYVRSIQTIVNRKRTSYFIEKNLAFIEEIVDRKDPKTLRGMCEGRTVRALMSILSLPRRPSTIETLLRVLLKTVRAEDDFGHKLRLETPFWDTIFTCVQLASGNDGTEAYVEVFTHDEARDIPTPRHSSKTEVEKYNKNIEASLAMQHTEQDARSVNECAHFALKLVETFLDDPLIMNFAQEYGVVEDFVECSRSHEPRISMAACNVLAKYVKSDGTLRDLVEGAYVERDLVVLGNCKVSKTARAALERLSRRTRAASIPPLSVLAGSSVSVQRDGVSYEKHGDVVAAFDAEDKCVYVYGSDGSPVFKIGSQSSKIAVSATSSSCTFAFGNETSTVKLNVNANAASWCDQVGAALKSKRAFGSLRPVSSFGAPVLRSVRTHTRRRRAERKKRVDAKAAAKKKASEGVISLSSAPRRGKKTLHRTKSTLRRPTGPSADSAPPSFDGDATMSPDDISFEPVVHNIDESDAIRWSDIAYAVPQLLVCARRNSSIAARVGETALALTCVHNALCAAGSMSRQACQSVVVEEEYGFVDTIVMVVKGTKSLDEDGEDATTSLHEDALVALTKCLMVCMDGATADRSVHRMLADVNAKLKTVNGGLHGLLTRLVSSTRGDVILVGVQLAYALLAFDVNVPVDDETKKRVADAVEDAKNANLRASLTFYANAIRHPSSKGRVGSLREAQQAGSSSSKKGCIIS